jgi:hypothetical protein
VIRLYIEPLGDDTQAHALAHNGIRMAASLLGFGSLSVEDAKRMVQEADVDGERVLLGEVDDRLVAHIANAQQILARYGLELSAEHSDGSEVDLGPAMPEVDEDDDQDAGETVVPGEDDFPCYLGSVIALSMMNAAHGDVSAALRTANTIRFAYKTYGDEDGVEIWNDVIRALFDAFPPREGGGGLLELATEVGR